MNTLKQFAFRLLQAFPLLRYHIRLTVPVVVGQAVLKLPIIEVEYPHYEAYEPWLFDALSRILVVRTGAFIDVGANRGQTL